MENNLVVVPLISIIIPVYNVEKYIEQCLDSVLSQKFVDYEIILIDDGSTDNSGSICDAYAQKYKHVNCVHRCNEGASAARNFGIYLAKGEFVLFIDSDDFITEDSLEKIVGTIECDDKLDLMFLEASKYLTSKNTHEKLLAGYRRDILINGTKESILNHLASLSKFPASPWAKLISRQLLIDSKIYFKEGITAEDLDWTVRLVCAANKFSYCEYPFYNYRQGREGSVTSSINEKKFNNLFNFIREYGVEDLHELSIYKMSIYSFVAYEYMVLLLVYSKLPKALKSKYFKELKQYSFILKYRFDNKSKCIRLLNKYFGLRVTIMMIHIYDKIMR